MKPKIISFDLDDTLWDNRKVIKQSEQGIYTYICKKYPKFSAFFSQKKLKALQDDLAKNNVALANQITLLRRTAIEQALTISGYRDKALIEQAMTIFFELRHRVNYHSFVVDILKKLSQSFTLATLTNGNADIARLSISDFFTYNCRAEEIGAQKSDKIFYLRAVEHMQIKPEELLHIGNHPLHDVLTPQKIGITTLWFNNGYTRWPKNSPKPVMQITTFATLPHTLHKILATTKN